LRNQPQDDGEPQAGRLTNSAAAAVHAQPENAECQTKSFRVSDQDIGRHLQQSPDQTLREKDARIPAAPAAMISSASTTQADPMGFVRCLVISVSVQTARWAGLAGVRINDEGDDHGREGFTQIGRRTQAG
jgi:hypothetical protein